MQGKKSILLILLFIITWGSVAFMGILFVNARIQNSKLKDSAAALEKRLADLNKSIDKYEEFRKKEEQVQKEALDYLQWQFVLRDQVTQANQRLGDNVNKIKNLSTDKALLNLLYYNLGLSFTLSVDFESAIKAFEDALRFDPKDAQTCYNLGLLYATNNKNIDKAVKYYKRYLELAPKGAKTDEVKQMINILEKR
ncbi:MAG: hypothetical protein WA066_06310 [Candidatus Omnitrophota bacterium]